ncbi:MAG: hypothetical protein ABWY71_02505 [Candidatus Saccharimonadales bacterium]
MDLRFLVTATRARVYLLWAILAPAGFVTTHFYQNHNVNYVWMGISLVGLGYMWRVMPLRVVQMRHIFLSWLVPIVAGIIFTGALFYLHEPWAGNAIAHLGAIWLGIMAIGYFLNGLADSPSSMYWFAVILNAGFAVACLFDVFLPAQYLVAAIVSAWSMLFLWLFRSDV